MANSSMNPSGKLPREFIRRAVAVGAFDLDGREIGRRQKTIAVNVNRSMAVLAGHPLLIMDVLLHRNVVLGVQRWLGLCLPRRKERR